MLVYPAGYLPSQHSKTVISVDQRVARPAMSLATQVEVPRAAGRAVHFAAAEGRDGGTAVDLVPVAVGDGGQLLGNRCLVARNSSDFYGYKWL
jgi:hypothetical protein